KKSNNLKEALLRKYANDTIEINRCHSIESELNHQINITYDLESYVNQTVDLAQITLFKNIAYIFSDTANKQSLYVTILISELISYSIGCQIG
ncbi:hypothetical protein FQZ90_26420, partial [Escherichia coli]|uniref:hypothetical protein n=1 Tax=Escherichia coli TaxID=562 RepID=UPI001327BAEA